MSEQQFFGGETTLAARNRGAVGVDVAAAVLILVAVMLPWSVSFGVGVPGSAGWLFGVLTVATLSSLASIAISLVGRGNPERSTSSAKTRLALNAPYLLLVFGFLADTVVKSVVDGGSGDVPPGIGPGALAGLSGALLAAQPVLDGSASNDGRLAKWFASTRTLGIAALVLATLAVLFNLYWRTRYVLPNVTDETTGGQSIAVVATALVYGAVALVGVWVGLRWLLRDEQAARLATVALGASTILGSVLVWSTGVGRDIDAFHGIAQNTSTAAIGFEGYIAWAAAGAIFGPLAFRQMQTAAPLDKAVWRDAARKCLVLIAVWCAGSAVLRIFDLIVSMSLDLPVPPYESMGLLAFDVFAAVIAIWVRFNITTDSLHPAVISAVSGVLFVFTVCRVVVGVGLAPRILYSPPPEGIDTAVYGNTLAHQITSTFDVVICGVALSVLAVAVFVLQLGGVKITTRRAAAPASAPRVEHEEICATEHILAPAQDDWSRAGVTTALGTAPPRISRTRADSTQKTDANGTEADATQKLPIGPPKIARLLDESTQRFGAGTTYTGTGRTQPPAGSDS